MIRPIGFVKRRSADKDVADKDVVSSIALRKGLAKGLAGVEEFSHLFIIFWMHKIRNGEKELVHRRHGAGSPVGVFACRGPIRPNPIGLTLVELVACERNILRVKGLDAFNGTPVLDIKPYGRPCDIAANFRAPERFTKD